MFLPSPVVMCGEPASSRLRFMACGGGGGVRRVGIVAVVCVGARWSCGLDDRDADSWVYSSLLLFQ